MINKRSISSWFVVLACACVWVSASPEDDRISDYLRSHNMLSLLEVQLEDRIGNAKDSDERTRLVEQLSGLYIEQLKAYGRDDPYRQIVLIRAQSLTRRMSSMPMYDLRIELLIEVYTAVESAVELSRLELLDQDQRLQAISELEDAYTQLGVLSSKLDPAVTHKERLSRRAGSGFDPEQKPTLSDLRRYRSLSHYYHAWSGYSLAVLKGQHVSSKVFISFGWLLGGEGGTARLSEVNESTLEYEHVARSAMGVALAYAQSEDALGGRMWAKFVADSEYAELETQQAAEDWYIQILAMDRDWTELYRSMLTIYRLRGDDQRMSVANARFLALQSLHAMQSVRVGKGGMQEAKRVARHAIEQLVEHGEIGHVLDLYKRFDSLPLLADSFITNYAHALGELNRAEQAGESGMFASVSSLFATALKASDAKKFPAERDDCTLKLAYTEIRSGRGAEAVKVCQSLIKRSTKVEVVEEARWLRIAAFDSINLKAGDATSKPIELAVREYIIAYPSSSRAAKLILRHAMQGTIDAQVAIDTLVAIDDTDPIVIPARRTLVGLRYKRLRARGFTDLQANEQVLDMIRWISEHEPEQVANLNDASARMATIRVGIDLAIRISPADIDFAQLLLEQALDLISFDQSLAKYRGEMVYRQIEIAVNDHRLESATKIIGELDLLDRKLGASARVLILNQSIQAWNKRATKDNAERIVDIGSQVLSVQMPKHPKPMSAQVSAVADVVAQAAVFLWETSDDVKARDLAMRLSLLVLDRGQPTEDGLRRITTLAQTIGDQTRELEAWLRLLGSYRGDDEHWYEARYESLRVMKEIDFARALSAYDQYRVMHPTLGPSPWNERIGSLFGDDVPTSDTPEGRTP